MATPQTQRGGILPPWLWFWLILYIVGLPGTFTLDKTDFLILLSGNDGTTSFAYNFVERWVSLGIALNDLILFIGVLSVFLPWLRAAFLEKKYDLIDSAALPAITLPGTIQTLDEVSNFIRVHAPDIIIRYSVVRLRDYAFVYPKSYRRVGIALSGSLLALWRADPQNAQAILLHEIAHYRHGDALVIGEGSLIETAVNYLFAFNAHFVVLPVLLSFIIGHISSFQEEMALTSNVQTILAFHLHQILTFDIPSLLLAILASLFRVAAIITLVLAAIWCAELNADRFVLDTTHSTQAVTQAEKQHAPPVSRRRWFLSRTTHPPVRMRRWLVQHSQNIGGLVLLLLIFPLAWFVRLFFLLGWASSQLLDFLYNGVSISSIGAELGTDVVYYLEALVPAWVAIAVLFLLWPFLTRFWEKIFAYRSGQAVNALYRPYLFSAGIIACVCLSGFMLSLTPSPISSSTTSSHQGTIQKHPGSLRPTYKGSIVNVAGTTNTSAPASLSFTKDDAQGNIAGYMTIQLPLAGSGPFRGTVSKNAISFTVTPDDGSGYAAIQFSGSINLDGSIAGTYVLPSEGQGGKWQVQPG